MTVHEQCGECELVAEIFHAISQPLTALEVGLEISLQQDSDVSQLRSRADIVGSLPTGLRYPALAHASRETSASRKPGSGLEILGAVRDHFPCTCRSDTVKTSPTSIIRRWNLTHILTHPFVVSSACVPRQCLFPSDF